MYQGTIILCSTLMSTTISWRRTLMLDTNDLRLTRGFYPVVAVVDGSGGRNFSGISSGKPGGKKC